jgi:polyisoprenoid-binding protein YceI
MTLLSRLIITGLIMGLLFVMCAGAKAFAGMETFFAPDGHVQSLFIVEQGAFARGYGIFTKGVARLKYDKDTEVLDDLKCALLMKSFSSGSPELTREMQERKGESNGKDEELAFVQDSPARFKDGKAQIKGQLIINNIRKDVTLDATLNKYGTISKTSDIFEDGVKTVGVSLHAMIKRSDYGLIGAGEAESPFKDEGILMIDVVGQH